MRVQPKKEPSPATSALNAATAAASIVPQSPVTLTTEIQQLRSELAAKDQELAVKHQELARKEQELGAKEQEIAAAKLEHAAAKLEHAAAKLELADERQLRAAKEQELQKLLLGVADREDWIDGVTGSTLAKHLEAPSSALLLSASVQLDSRRPLKRVNDNLGHQVDAVLLVIIFQGLGCSGIPLPNQHGDVMASETGVLL
ncbi:hypothetical protein CAOG_009731 [Capsaspora owczarzaki ATCC 30864]|uniref:Uncharacterized protein n=1 Tax=Capsaspora owczarzaki (strain ATCC 30864) TaxID=595528 RepID=A0A0D2UDM2_CAPO3|nr:hypothetical protein CAOG_009731 [Capsaspora owczarzaki ATCC 30864]